MSKQVSTETVDGYVEQHFVTFSSPGTFFNEESTKPIDSWDIAEALILAQTVKERHGATPFAFHFTTRGREPEELDSKQIAKSPRYFLGGNVSTQEEVIARNDPSEDILRSNMRANKIKRIIINDNSSRSCQPIDRDDVVLQWPMKGEEND